MFRMGSIALKLASQGQLALYLSGIDHLLRERRGAHVHRQGQDLLADQHGRMGCGVVNIGFESIRDR